MGTRARRREAPVCAHNLDSGAAVEFRTAARARKATKSPRPRGCPCVSSRRRDS